MVDGNLAELLAFALKTRRARFAPKMPTPPTTSKRRFQVLPVLALAALPFLSTGCGNTLYAIQVNSASSKLEEAHELGAEEYAPYEYWFALQHIDKAQSEASEGDYGDAIELAGIGEEYADKAIQLSREARRGAGR